mmetsp:Transcript_25208/g.58043  ORF Transcript_25208/g.58043 Transcript_25208/m.58043 type:complete len:238 (+) Transcript_25208:502-1215(+)
MKLLVEVLGHDDNRRPRVDLAGGIQLYGLAVESKRCDLDIVIAEFVGGVSSKGVSCRNCVAAVAQHEFLVACVDGEERRRLGERGEVVEAKNTSVCGSVRESGQRRRCLRVDGHELAGHTARARGPARADGAWGEDRAADSLRSTVRTASLRPRRRRVLEDSLGENGARVDHTLDVLAVHGEACPEVVDGRGLAVCVKDGLALCVKVVAHGVGEGEGRGAGHCKRRNGYQHGDQRGQ